MQVIASTRPNRPYLKNADIIRVNGAYIFADELIKISKLYEDKPLFVDIPNKRSKVNISDISVDDVKSILKTKRELNYNIKNIIAFSKVESVNDLIIGDHYLTCAKIESLIGILHFDLIVNNIDIVCIDRVDLINELKDIKTYLAYEEYIIRVAKSENKQIFIASDILPSLIKCKKSASSLLPEMVQLKYYQDKCVDGVILAEETAVGFYPYHAIDIVKSINKKKLEIKETINHASTDTRSS